MSSYMNNVGIGMMISFAGMGVTFDNQVETEDSLTLYISVPEHSYCKDAKGIEMSGTTLAKRYKKVMEELGVKRLILKAKIRKGDFWTKEDDELAREKMKKVLFKSQH